MQMQNIFIISYISLAIVGLSLVLNIFGIYLILKQGARRTNQCVITLHLSILQVLIGSGILAYWISVLTKSANNDGIKKWNVPILISSRITVLLIIAILTFDRLLLIKYSLRHRTIASKKRVNVASAISWLSWAVSFSIVKSLIKEAHLAVFSVVVTIIDCLLLVFILYTYIYIYWRIRVRHRNLINTSAINQQIQSGGKQALRVSTAIIVSFTFLVLIPDVVLAIAKHFVDKEASKIIVYTGIMVNNCYYVALPVTYIFLHKEMRRMLLSIMMKCCCRKDMRCNNAVPIKKERVEVTPV